MDDRQVILEALPEDTGSVQPSSSADLLTVPQGDLWPAFTRMLEFHKGELGSIEAVQSMVGKAVFDEDAFRVLGLADREQPSLWQAEAGVTLCDAAIAETGSLLLSAGPGRQRLHSLVPPVHIVLLDPGQVVASLDEGLARLTGRTAALVTGPSRTADVEGVIVMGVHGPKRLIVVPIPAQIPA
jgi:L-lactate utilization protein LutC